MQMHVGAVEQRVAFAQHGDRPAGLEVLGDRRRRRLVEAADRARVVVAASLSISVVTG